MMSPNSDQVAFWRAFHSEEFLRRFHGRVHPLQESNGGVAFHNPENLRKLLQQAQHDYETMPKVGMSAWGRKNRVDVINSWLDQVLWIFGNAL